jgi:ABC-type amino acid transport substrate-binding protein
MDTAVNEIDLVNAEGTGSTSRRKFIKSAFVVGAGAVAVGVAGCSTNSTSSAAAATSGAAAATAGSLLNRVTSSKKISFGVDLTFPPLQFKDPKNNNVPSGYIIDLANLMAKDLGATPTFVEVPFAQLFAAQAAGKFDMSGIAATILPSRAEKVLFANQPAFIESEVILLKPGLKIKNVGDLNASNVTLAVLVGSSQEATAPLLFPKATIKSLDNQSAIQDVASGRSTATLLSEFNVVQALAQHPGITVFNGPSVFVDINSFFMPAGDFAMQAWVDNWLMYQTSHGMLAGLWNKYVGDGARAAGLPTVPVKSPYA